MKYKLIIHKDADEEIIAIVHSPSSLTQQIEDIVCNFSGVDSIMGYRDDEMRKLAFSEIECITILERKVIAIDTAGKHYRIPVTNHAVRSGIAADQVFNLLRQRRRPMGDHPDFFFRIFIDNEFVFHRLKSLLFFHLPEETQHSSHHHQCTVQKNRQKVCRCDLKISVEQCFFHFGCVHKGEYIRDLLKKPSNKF